MTRLVDTREELSWTRAAIVCVATASASCNAIIALEDDWVFDRPRDGRGGETGGGGAPAGSTGAEIGGFGGDPSTGGGPRGGGTGGTGGTAGSGGDGGCGPSQKLCGGACVDVGDPAYGCG